MINFMTAEVDIRANLAPLRRGLAKAKAIVRRFATGIQRVLNRISFRRLAIAGVAAAVAITLALRKFVQAAGDAIEIQGKFNVVFGKFAKATTQWAADFGLAVGRARQDIKRWLSGIQDILVPMGYARRDATKLSKAIVKLAVDVGSFSNVASEDVLRDFTSALVGNHETVRKYGIMIDEATIKQAALNMGLDKNYKQLTASEKLQARYNIIVASSSDANTDATRTAGEYANQLQRLWGNIKNVSQTIGGSMVGAVRDWLVSINTFLEKNESAIGDWAAKAVAHVKYFAGVLKTFWQNTDFKGKWQSMLDSIIIMLKAFVKAAIILAVAAGQGLWKGMIDGMLGGSEARIARRTKQIYGRTSLRTDEGKRADHYRVTGWGLTATQTPTNKLQWNAAKDIATREESARLEKAIIAPAFKEVGDLMVAAAEEVKARTHAVLSLVGQREIERLKDVRGAAISAIDAARIVAMGTKAFLSGRSEFSRLEGITVGDKPTAAFRSADIEVSKEIKSFGEKITESFKTNQQKFSDFSRKVAAAIVAGWLAPGLSERALAKGREDIFGKPEKKEGVGAFLAAGGLVNLAALALGAKTDPALEEAKKQTKTLQNIDDNTKNRTPALSTI